jgi:competence protein ComEC
MTSPNSGSTSLSPFLEYLRQNGFSVGVGHYLRAQLLLDRIQRDYELQGSKPESRSSGQAPTLWGDYEPEDLKTILCPLFASNKEEQRRFYQLFDGYLSYEESASRQPGRHKNKPPPIDDRRPRRSWQKTALPLTAILLAAITLPLLLWIYRTYRVKPVTVTAEVKLGTRQRDTTDKGSGSTIRPPGVKPPLPPLVEPVTVQPRPSPNTLAYMLAAAVCLLGFSFHDLYLRLHSKRLLDKQHDKKLPSIWPLRVEAPQLKLYGSTQFYQAVRGMRRRQADALERLHIGETISATIKALGYPVFRTKPGSKAPEYLLLVDRASPDDHQAELFNELFKALKYEGVFAVRYFYNGDPRRCYDETGRDSYHLITLRDRYPGHRLLVFGSGEKFTNARTGSLAAWSKLFSDWQDRTLLTPVSPLQWGLRETELAGRFVLLPATTYGLQALITRRAPVAGARSDGLTDSSLPPLPKLAGTDLVPLLRDYLGDDVFQWLCACALHTQLRWNLTLRMGMLPSMKPGLVTEESLLRLVRLPWFRQGSLPDDLRWQLIESLDKRIEKEARELLLELLKQDAPPAGTFAAASRRLEIALQEWQLLGDRQSLRELKVALEDVPPGDVTEDRTTASYLQRLPVPFLIRWLPGGQRRRFYYDRIPAFGFKRFARLLITLAFMSFLLLGLWRDYVPLPATLRHAPQAKAVQALYVYVLDVGQGDSMLIVTPSRKYVLIDAGPADASDRVIAELRRLNVNQLDLLVATHPHADHIGGVVSVVNNFPVKRYLDSGQAMPSQIYQRVLAAVREKNIEFTTASRGQVYDLGDGARLEVLNPVESSSSQTTATATPNDSSQIAAGNTLHTNCIVMRLTYAGFTMIFTGDANLEAEQRMLKDGLALRANILQVGHHGSTSSTGSDFLNAVHPANAIISAGIDNLFRVPRQATLDRLRQAGAQVFRTDLQGEIMIRATGTAPSQISFTSEWTASDADLFAGRDTNTKGDNTNANADNSEGDTGTVNSSNNPSSNRSTNSNRSSSFRK